MALDHDYGYFYTYYYTSNYIQKSGGIASITKYLTNTHIANVKKAIENKKTIPSDQIKILENTYNDRIKAQNKIMQKLINKVKKEKDKDALNTLIAVVKTINKNISDEAAEKIALNLDWNEEIQNIYVTGNSFKTENVESDFSSWNIGEAESYRSAKVAIRHIDEAIKKLTRNFSQNQIAPYLEKLTALKAEIIDLPEVSSKIINVNGERKTVYSGRLEKGERDFAFEIWNVIYMAKTDLEGIADLNRRLQANWAELVVNLVGNRGKAYGLKEFQQAILRETSKRAPGNVEAKAKKSNLLSVQAKFTDQDYLRKLVEQAEAEAKKNNGRALENFVRKVTPKNGKVTYQFKEQVGVHGKTDAFINIEMESGKAKKGVSVKNYGLQSGDISLQDHGYLSHYLEDSPSDKLMNHILNIYSKHPDSEEGDRNKYPNFIPILINYGQDAMRVNLLYSALSGYMQQRIGREAELLLIYDKDTQGNQLIRLYSIPDIVLSMIEKKDFTGVKIDPSFSKPIFENTYEEAIEDSREGNEKAARLRMTKVLHEMRSQNIAISLSTKILR